MPEGRFHGLPAFVQNVKFAKILNPIFYVFRIVRPSKSEPNVNFLVKFKELIVLVVLFLQAVFKVKYS